MPTHYTGEPREILALDTFIKLTRATDSLLSRLARRNTLIGLTPSQFGVLEALHHLGPMCQSVLGEKLLKSGGNITLVIDNLEKSGLVKRIRNPEDRRFITVSLTEAGKQLVEQILPGHVNAIMEEMGSLSADEQQVLGNLCRKLGKGS